MLLPEIPSNEDSAAGSVQCTLAPYWSEKLGKLELAASPTSARGGELLLRLEGERVKN
jgi:predicted PhzF superfamily epimerase YddE/YHI9